MTCRRVREAFGIIIAVAGLAVATPVAAQLAPKPARIAMVCGFQCQGPVLDILQQALRELGRVEGQNLVIDERGAKGQKTAKALGLTVPQSLLLRATEVVE